MVFPTVPFSVSNVLIRVVNTESTDPDGTVIFAETEDFIGSDYDDYFYLTASTAGHKLDGGAGNDHIEASLGNDEIIGGAGNDEIYGAAGNDIINGGAGDDNIAGGTGIDTFVFNANDGADAIGDFDSSIEIIDFSNISGLTFNDLTITDQAGDALVDYGTGQITLVGVNIADLDANDFAFGA